MGARHGSHRGGVRSAEERHLDVQARARRGGNAAEPDPSSWSVLRRNGQGVVRAGVEGGCKAGIVAFTGQVEQDDVLKRRNGLDRPDALLVTEVTGSPHDPAFECKRPGGSFLHVRTVVGFDREHIDAAEVRYQAVTGVAEVCREAEGCRQLAILEREPIRNGALLIVGDGKWIGAHAGHEFERMVKDAQAGRFGTQPLVSPTRVQC